ncbi:MAG: PAS domain-containing protein [Deltaproteobacteria bacterium]
MIKGTIVGTWEWNVQTRETIFNDRWAEIIGYTMDEISPVAIETWMKYTHPEDLKSSEELLEKHFRGEIDYYKFESRMKHKVHTLKRSATMRVTGTMWKSMSAPIPMPSSAMGFVLPVLKEK